MRSIGAPSARLAGVVVQVVEVLAGPELALEFVVAARAPASGRRACRRSPSSSPARRAAGPAMTSCTTKLACSTRVRMERSWFIGGSRCRERLDGRNAARPEGSGIDAADADRALGQQLALRRARPAARCSCWRRPRSRTCTVTVEQVVEPRRAQVAHAWSRLTMKIAPCSVRSVSCAKPSAAQPLGARALEELQVVGVEHHAAGVGVFPVDAQRVREGVQAGCGHAGAASCRAARISSAAARACTPGPTAGGPASDLLSAKLGSAGARRGTAASHSAHAVAGAVDEGQVLVRGGAVLRRRAGRSAGPG